MQKGSTTEKLNQKCENPLYLSHFKPVFKICNIISKWPAHPIFVSNTPRGRDLSLFLCGFPYHSSASQDQQRFFVWLFLMAGFQQRPWESKAGWIAVAKCCISLMSISKGWFWWKKVTKGGSMQLSLYFDFWSICKSARLTCHLLPCTQPSELSWGRPSA